MRRNRSLVFACAVVIAVLGAACGRDESSAPRTEAGPLPFDHRFVVKVGDEPVRMRVAVRPHEQQRGLMHVRSMPEDEGMLFVYESGRRVSFWMRNTYIPLDIGYFDASGMLKEIHSLFPHVEDPVPSAAEDIRYALEMNAGWFAKHGIVFGAKLDTAALAAALEARGIDAKVYVGAR